MATNDDATYPTPDGPIPGGGAILASIVTACGVSPIVAGKPHGAMVELVRDRLGLSGVVVGDRPDTDGLFARALGFDFALVHSGVTDAAQIVDPPPDLVAADLAALRPAAAGRLLTLASTRVPLVGFGAMAQSDLLKRYIDAGVSFTNLTQNRAERLVKELVKAGELQADQAREAVADLVERSRKSSERLLELISKEVRSQITSLGLASQADLDRIERRMAKLMGKSGKSKAKAAKKAPAKKAGAKKAAPAKKATKKAAPAKKATKGAGQEGDEEGGSGQEGDEEGGAGQEGARAGQGPGRDGPVARVAGREGLSAGAPSPRRRARPTGLGAESPTGAGRRRRRPRHRRRRAG